MATKAATTIAGGLGAEAGGEMAGAPGRFLGGMAGGAGAGFASAERQADKVAALLPNKEANTEAANAAYGAIKDAKLVTTPEATERLTSGVRDELDDELITDAKAPGTFHGIKKLENSGGKLADVMNIYEKLGNIGPDEGKDYVAANMVRRAITNWIDTLPNHEVLTGDPEFTSAMWQHGRATWRVKSKLEEVERAQEMAGRRAAASGTGANFQNTLRQEFRKIIDSSEKSRGYSPEAKEKIEQIVAGTFATNAARKVGKFAPSGPLSATTAIFTGMEAGVPAGAAVAVAAELSKHLGTYLTKRQIKELSELIASESPLAKPTAGKRAAMAPNRGAILPAASARASIAEQGNDAITDQAQ